MKEIDIDLQEILDEVEEEWGMGGLSTGLYADYAKEVAARLLKRIYVAVKKETEDS